MTGQCRHDKDLFCLFLPTHKKKEGNPTHIAHIAKATRTYAENKTLSKSAILQTHLNNILISKVVFHSIKGNNLVTS